MDKIFYYLIGIFLLIAALVVYFFIWGNIQGEQYLSDEEKKFMSLCSQWLATKCGLSEIETIDESQDMLGERTLTEACLRKFNYPMSSSCSQACAEQRTLILCQDVCKNNCFSQLFYDLSIIRTNIIRDSSKTYITIYVNNTGTASVFDLNISVFNRSTGKFIFSVTKDIPSKNSTSIYCNINSWYYSNPPCGQSILVKIDSGNKINETSEENNEADNEWQT